MYWDLAGRSVQNADQLAPLRSIDSVASMRSAYDEDIAAADPVAVLGA